MKLLGTCIGYIEDISSLSNFLFVFYLGVCAPVQVGGYLCAVGSPLLCVFLVLDSNHRACEQVPLLLSHLIGPLSYLFRPMEVTLIHSTPFTLRNLYLKLKFHVYYFIKVTKFDCQNKKLDVQTLPIKKVKGKY